MTTAAGVEALYAELYDLLFRLATSRYGMTSEVAEEAIHAAMLAYLNVRDRVENPKQWIIAQVMTACARGSADAGYAPTH